MQLFGIDLLKPIVPPTKDLINIQIRTTKTAPADQFDYEVEISSANTKKHIVNLETFHCSTISSFLDLQKLK